MIWRLNTTDMQQQQFSYYSHKKFSFIPIENKYFFSQGNDPDNVNKKYRNVLCTIVHKPVFPL